MTFAGPPAKLRSVRVALCLAPVSMVGPVTAAKSTPGVATLHLDPAAVDVKAGDSVTLALWVEGVENLQTAELQGDLEPRSTVPCYALYTRCTVNSPASSVALTSDINGDCRVDILDLTQSAGNLG